MNKNKKQVNKLEKIESYFTTKNEHYNKYAFDLYKGAKENNLFKDLEIPLGFFSRYTDIFVTHRAKPLQVAKQFVEEMKNKKLNNKQQLFILGHLISWFGGWLTSFTDENGNEYSMKTVAELLKQEIKRLQPLKKTEPEIKDTFDWDKTKQHLATLPDITEKIKYLIIRKTEFQQENGVNRKDRELIYDYTWFDEKCEIEIKKLGAFRKLEPQISTDTKAKSQFKLSNKRGTKTDLIRILNAVWELKMIEDKDGQIPTKEFFMNQAGEFLGTDLSNYEVDLSQAMNNTKIEANLKIFEDMKTVTQNKVYADKKK